MISFYEGEGGAPRKAVQDRALVLHLQVCDCNPPIWRRLLVRESMWLSDLHEAIQIMFAWCDYQTHAFTVGHTLLGNPFKRDGVVVEDDRQVTLQDIQLGECREIVYDYHFCEGWRVWIRVEGIRPVKKGQFYPCCLSGARAGPPEDCGGVDAYHDMLEAIREPYSELGREWLEWLGDDADTERCDIAEINKALKALNEDSGKEKTGRG